MSYKHLLPIALFMVTVNLLGQQPPRKTNQEGKTQQPQAQLSNSDELFLNALIQEDISEISLAKMALQKSSNPDVKQYAQTKILAADPAMRDGAEKIARQYGLQPPTEPNARQKKIHDELSGKTGKLFDTAYMSYEASQQTSDLKLVKTGIQNTTNPQMKDYAAKEETPVQEAASAATKLSTQIASGMTHYRQPAAK